MASRLKRLNIEYDAAPGSRCDNNHGSTTARSANLASWPPDARLRVVTAGHGKAPCPSRIPTVLFG